MLRPKGREFQEQSPTCSLARMNDSPDSLPRSCHVQKKVGDSGLGPQAPSSHPPVGQGQRKASPGSLGQREETQQPPGPGAVSCGGSAERLATWRVWAAPVACALLAGWPCVNVRLASAWKGASRLENVPQPDPLFASWHLDGCLDWESPRSRL